MAGALPSMRLMTARRALLIGLCLAIGLACATSEAGRTLGLPETGTIVEMQSGDLACYVTIKERTEPLFASFEVCAKPLVGRVRFRYERANINDCQSNEPCGRTKTVDLVVGVEPTR